MACLFCQIAEKAQPADIVYEDEDVIVFKDIIPKQHLATVNDIDDVHIPLMGQLFATAKRLAEQWSIAEQGYRLTVNVGRGGGQVIDHIHMHMVSGWKRPA
jgi:histidine triad (HIT) family protein